MARLLACNLYLFLVFNRFWHKKSDKVYLILAKALENSGYQLVV